MWVENCFQPPSICLKPPQAMLSGQSHSVFQTIFSIPQAKYAVARSLTPVTKTSACRSFRHPWVTKNSACRSFRHLGDEKFGMPKFSSPRGDENFGCLAPGIKEIVWSSEWDCPESIACGGSKHIAGGENNLQTIWARRRRAQMRRQRCIWARGVAYGHGGPAVPK